MDNRSVESAETVEVAPGVFLTQLVAGEEMSIQHVRMDPGAQVPPHSHHHEQVGYVFSGELTFEIDAENSYRLRAGDSYHLRSDEPHAAENSGDVPLIAIDIFSPPRADPDWLD